MSLLGWTAIGRIQNLDSKDSHYTAFHPAFRLQIERREPTSILPEKDTSTPSCILKRFWHLESIGIIPTSQQLTLEDKFAWAKVNRYFKFNGQLYEEAVPRRD